MPDNSPTIRAIYQAVAIPGAAAPYNAAQLKIYYPAVLSGSNEERNTGVVGADTALAPYPVVILLPGINLGPEAYRWLAEHLARQGVVTVTYSLIAEEMPGYISQTPGLDLSQLSPENYGKAPSATTIGPIIACLQALQNSSVLQGLLDLESIVLGGHSAGGTVALLNANPNWFPQLKAAFSYGAHSGASMMLGYEADTLLAIPPDLPLLVIGGSEDGCIAESSHRYGEHGIGSPTDRVERSFDQAVPTNAGQRYLLLIEGANHFSFAHPEDSTTGRPFIDWPAKAPGQAIRELLANAIGLFIRAHVHSDNTAAKQLRALLDPAQALVRSSRSQ